MSASGTQRTWAFALHVQEPERGGDTSIGRNILIAAFHALTRLKPGGPERCS